MKINLGGGAYMAAVTYCPRCGLQRLQRGPFGDCTRCGAPGFITEREDARRLNAEWNRRS